MMLGRPFLYALGAAGENGLRQCVEMIENEISVTMAQIGCVDVEALDGTVIA